MNFMDLFVPMTAAFVAASLIVEALHTLLGIWITKRHQARAQEYYNEVAKQMGISPEEFKSKMENQINYMGGMDPMSGSPGMTGMPMGDVTTTASGSGEHEGQGQYL